MRCKQLVALLNLLLLVGGVSVSVARKRASKRPRTRQQTFSALKDDVRLVTLDPGHFHAALVRKTMYANVSPVVRVYAPPGNDLDEHLKGVEGYNARAANPTRWKEELCTAPDFLERMLEEKPGNSAEHDRQVLHDHESA